MDTPRTVAPRRIDALTGVRILAAGAVFLSHVGAPAFAPEPVKAFASAGYNGVALFFVLSGFVLAWNYGDRLTGHDRRAVWSFAVARFARIYPLYLAALVWVVAPRLLTTGVSSDLWLHVFAVQAWTPSIPVAYNYNGPAWSISVEFFLYACLPLVVLAFNRIRHRPAALLAAAATAIAATFALAWWFTATGRAVWPNLEPDSAHFWLYQLPLTRLGDFVVGVVAAMLIRAAHPHPRLGAAAQVVGGVAIVALMAWPALLFTAWSWDAAYLLPTFLLLWGLAAGPNTVLSRALGSRPMVAAGEASFAFYLLHVPLLAVLTFVTVDGWAGWAYLNIARFVVILAVAFAAHVVIELPAQRWLRRTLDTRRPAVILSVPPVVEVPVPAQAMR